MLATKTCDSNELPPAKRPKRGTPQLLMHEGEETLKRRKKHIPDSLELHYGEKYPVKFVRGEMQYLFDENGDRYLDTANSISHVGHCHPKVVEAGHKQMATLNLNTRFLSDKRVSYAEKLCATFPEGSKLTHCVFTNSGSEASDLALQIAQAFTGHSQVISLEGAYHGHLMSLRQLSTDRLAKKALEDGPSSSFACIAPIPDVYRGKYCDPATAGELYAGEVKKIIEEQHSCGKKIAAFIHESIMCCAGHISMPKGFLEAVYAEVRKAGGVCIADEVQCGFGRMGDTFWAYEDHDVSPDIVTMGKPMGNGHPVSGVVMKTEIAEKLKSSIYYNSFGGNPVSMAIAEAVLMAVQEEGMQDHVKEMGSILLEGFRGLMERYSCIGDVRGGGLFIGVEFVKDRESKTPDKKMCEDVVELLFLDHRIVSLIGGVDENVIKCKPPLCITKEDCESFIDSLGSVLAKLTS